MFDKFSQALALMREAFEDAQTGATYLACVDLAAEVDGAQQVINAAAAVQVLRVAQYAGREEEQDAAGAWVEVDHGVGHVSEFASDCFGPMLAMGPVAASRKVDTAAALASKLPRTLAAMSAGDLDSWRATIIATELSEASPASCAAVEALIHPAVLAEAPGAVTKRVRRVLARIDADALRVKAAKERLDRFVHAYPSHVPGLTTWVASLPAADSAACWAAIDDLAHTMHGDDPTRTLEQCRADALVDLMLTNVQVSTTVTLMIPVQTVTVDEPDDALERDLLVRGQPNGGQPTGQHRRLRPTHPGPEPAGRTLMGPDLRHGLRDPRHRRHRRRHRRRDHGPVRHPHRPGPARRTYRRGHRDRHHRIPAQPGDAPLHPTTRRPLQVPRLQPQRQTMRTRPRHPVLPRRANRDLEPGQPVQTPPPGQTPRRLDPDHDQGRRLHLDRPPPPAVRHLPDQPPRARSLNR